MAKRRKRYITGQLVDPTLEEAIDDAIDQLYRWCDCDGRGCNLCIAADNLRAARERTYGG